MKRKTISCARLESAAVMILSLLSAVPAAAAPHRDISFPQICFHLDAPFNHLSCSSQTGKIANTETPSGVTIITLTSKVEATYYEGRTKAGRIAYHSESTYDSKNVIKADEERVFLQRYAVTYDDPVGLFGVGSCTFQTHFVYAGGELRRDSVDMQCA